MTDLGVVPARHAKAILLRMGQSIEIINTYGNQVLDTWAFNANDMSEHMSMEHTRSVNSRVLAQAGNALFSNHRRKMLQFVRDSSPGKHDMLLCACNHALYVELGCNEYHRNCQDNLHEALQELGRQSGLTPSPLNLFMNVDVGEDGSVLRSPPASRPGDSVEFLAEMDLLLVMSSCPQDIKPVNGEACTPRDVHYRLIK